MVCRGCLVTINAPAAASVMPEMAYRMASASGPDGDRRTNVATSANAVTASATHASPAAAQARVAGTPSA
jgi:hypothetical protein